jgi:hypothetical protein
MIAYLYVACLPASNFNISRFHGFCGLKERRSLFLRFRASKPQPASFCQSDYADLCRQSL